MTSSNEILDYWDPFASPVLNSPNDDPEVVGISNTLHHLPPRLPRTSFDDPSSPIDPLSAGSLTTTTSDPSSSVDNSTVDLMAIYYDTIAFENTVGIVIPTIYSLIIFIGLVGNALVITVVLLNRHMRNSTNMLIVNLAIADLLFLVFCVPFTAADYALPIWVFSYSWCQILQYLQYVTAYASVWLLVLMAFDRFLAVCLPVQSLTLRTVRNTLCVAGAVWVLIFVLNVPLLQIYGIHRYYFIMEDRASCTFVAQANRTASEFQVQLHHLSFVTWGYLVPLSITCIFYFFMLRRLWWGMPAARLGSRASEESIRAKKKVTWMVSGVITTFAICWAPLNACFAISALTYRYRGDHWVATKSFVIVQFASQILAYANSCLNPILYAFLSENFRKGFFKICGFLFCCGETKLDFERTNEYGHMTTPGGTMGARFSATPQSESVRVLVGSKKSRIRRISQQSSSARNKSKSQQQQQRQESSLIGTNDGDWNETTTMARQSANSNGSRENDRRRSSPPTTGASSSVSVYRTSSKEPSSGIAAMTNTTGAVSATTNGDLVVLYNKNCNEEVDEGYYENNPQHNAYGQQNGRNSGNSSAILPSKRVVAPNKTVVVVKDACEESLLGMGPELGDTCV